MFIFILRSQGNDLPTNLAAYFLKNDDISILKLKSWEYLDEILHILITNDTQANYGEKGNILKQNLPYINICDKKKSLFFHVNGPEIYAYILIT